MGSENATQGKFYEAVLNLFLTIVDTIVKRDNTGMKGDYMAFKRLRELKVYEKFRQHEVVPEIRLQGKWLGELDFLPGTPIVVQCHGGRLIVEKRDEIWVDATGKPI